MDERSIHLIASTVEDKRTVYKWLCESDVSDSMFGFDSNEKPTWDAFCEDYEELYFDGTNPEFGRVFMIVLNGKKIGCVSYASFHLREQMAELDIWMDSEANCGKGYGTLAIIELCNYLETSLGINNYIIRPSIKNARAIKAYKKAGFKEVEKTNEKQVLHKYLTDQYYKEYGQGDYGEEGTLTLIMERTK